MKVLVACECSQKVCKAFRARSIEAFSCDIQDCFGLGSFWSKRGGAGGVRWFVVCTFVRLLSLWVFYRRFPAALSIDAFQYRSFSAALSNGAF